MADISYIPSNAYTYEQIETLLLATHAGKTSPEVSVLLGKARTASAIDSVLRKFEAFHNSEEGIYVSSILRNHFSRYLQEHGNEIPNRVASAQPTEEEQVEPEVETQVKEEKEDSGISSKSLNEWWKQGTEVILNYIKIASEERVQAEMKKVGKKLEELEKENERLRTIEEKYNTIKQALS